MEILWFSVAVHFISELTKLELIVSQFFSIIMSILAQLPELIFS